VWGKLLTSVSFNRDQPRHAFKLQRAASRNFDASKRLHEIGVPTLILHGKKDGITPLALAEEIHRDIAGSMMITFDGGHMFLFLETALTSEAGRLKRARSMRWPDVTAG
jgi:pimeloyl-ACP methyl ester carboxylesterase